MKISEAHISSGLFAVALAARLAAVSLGVVVGNDGGDYLRQAEAIASGRLQLGFPNGYPLLIAPLVTLLSGDALYWAIGTLNAVLSAAVAPLAFVMMRRVGVSAALAALGALAIAAWPHQLNYARQALSEAPAAFWLTLSCASVLLSRPALSGAALAAAILTRPTFVLRAPVIAFALHAAGRAREARTFGLVLALILVAYASIQWAATGVFGLSGNLRVNIAVAAQWNPYAPAFNVTYPPSLYDAIAVYLDALWSDPAHFVTVRLLNLLDLFGPWPLEDIRDWPARLMIGLRFPVALLYLAGMARLIQSREWVAIAALASPVVVVAIVHTVLFATPRFAVPIEPLLIVGAALGAQSLGAKFRHNGRPAFHATSPR